LDIKERILAGAKELFMRYGLKSVTMDDVARHLGMSKKTIYQFYSDKHDLVSQICEVHLSHEKCHLEGITSSAINVLDESIKIGDHLRREIQHMNPGLLYELQKFHPAAWKIYLEHKNSVIIELIKQNLQRGIDEGFFRPDIHIEIMARLRIEQIQMAFDPKVFPKDQFSFADIQIQLLEHYTRGLLTKKGFLELERLEQNQTKSQPLSKPL
jgi:TetR/AcrR family transcriptional regulator, cholesterol catabolism regulator